MLKMMRISKVTYKIQFGQCNVQLFMDTGDHVSIKLCYQYRDPHYKNKTVSWLSYLYNGNNCIGKDSLYIETALIAPCIQRDTICSTENCSQWHFIQNLEMIKHVRNFISNRYMVSQNVLSQRWYTWLSIKLCETTREAHHVGGLNMHTIP